MYNFIILAAGNGTRMKSNLPKVLHKINNLSMLEILTNTVKNISEDDRKEDKNENKIVSVISEKLDKEFKDLLPKNSNYVIQKEQLGTGHATKIALEEINKNNSKTIIIYSDQPLVTKETLLKMLKILDEYNFVALGFEMLEENKYGKMLLEKLTNFKIGEALNLFGIKEAKEYKENEEQPKICNSGFLAFRTSDLLENIHKVDNNNATGEYYLTQMVEILINQNKKAACLICDAQEVYGVNTPEELKIAEEILNRRNKYD